MDSEHGPMSVLNNYVPVSLSDAFSFSAHVFLSFFPRIQVIVRKDGRCPS